MTCTCNETREMDEYGTSYEGDFEGDFEAMLDELDQEDFVGPAAARKPAPPDPRKLSNVRLAPFKYICSIDNMLASGARVSGSGTLIGPQIVLTTAHTLCFPDSQMLLTPSRLRIVPGRAGVSPRGSAKAVWLRPYPGWRGGPESDIGIIVLDRPISETDYWTYEPSKGAVVTHFMGAQQGTRQVHVSGYPPDMPRNAKCPPCVARRPATLKRNPLCGTSQYTARHLRASINGKTLRYADPVCLGMDGGPVWMSNPSETKVGLVGVHSDKSGGAAVLDSDVKRWLRCFLR